MNKTTALIVVQNGEKTLFRCLEAVARAGFDDQIVIVGKSTHDRTAVIAQSFQCKIHIGLGLGLTRDRQLAVDLCTTTWASFIDADHIVPPNFIQQMFLGPNHYNLHFTQSFLEIYRPATLLQRGENDYYKLVHNRVGPRKTVGTAPSLFKTDILKSNSSSSIYTGTNSLIDDTQWAMRAEVLGLRLGVVSCHVAQIHAPRLRDYFQKFWWYGRGDAETLKSQPSKRLSFLAHLIFRYPFVYPARALYQGYPLASLYTFFQGLTRGFSASLNMCRGRRR